VSEIMLFYHASALLKEPAGATRNIEIDEPDPAFAAELGLGAPVTGTAHLMRTQEGIAVRADLHTVVLFECSRCLDPVSWELDAHLEELYRPAFNVMTGAPLEAGEDDALKIDEHHVLDMTEAARQYLLTNTPVSVLCQPDCKGLCPTCGINRNVESCSCDEEPASGPFGALAGLLPGEGTSATSS
jgi:uncharacterized protein